MLAYIKGTLAYKDAERAIVETGGIGYELTMSTHALASLPTVGKATHVWTYMHVKEDGISLFGFSHPSEKELFLKLITISGVGPKIGISALSTFKPAELISVIQAGDISAISRISGIGKKTAQRIVLELQGILASEANGMGTLADANANAQMRDAVTALTSMGFSNDEVSAALKGCEESDTSGIIRYALKHMGGNA